VEETLTGYAELNEERKKWKHSNKELEAFFYSVSHD
jgi:light-regulated signal transduction histidine kinase (bacteriophytochrome)